MALDWFRAAIASLGAMSCFVVALSVGPRFQKMYADFGSQLPALTRLVLMPWFPLVLGLVPFAMLALAVARRPPVGGRHALTFGALWFSLLANGLCAFALYLPILTAFQRLG